MVHRWVATCFVTGQIVRYCVGSPVTSFDGCAGFCPSGYLAVDSESLLAWP